MKSLLCFVFSAVMALSLISCRSTSTEADETSFNTSSDQNIVFQGSNANITYMGLSEASGISGCFYLSLQIENTGSSECAYNLADVYVNDSSCNTGSGVPVVAQSGKSTTGVFIVFTDLKVDDISSVEFYVEIRDNETFSLLETSNIISITV